MKDRLKLFSSNWIIIIVFFVFVFIIGFYVYSTRTPKKIESKVADIVLVFDTTGSMRDEIQNVKAILVDFIDSLKKAGINSRLGLITYGCIEERSVIRKTVSLTSNINLVRTQLDALNIGGGSTEDPITAFYYMFSKFKFRKSVRKIVIFVTDEPYVEPAKNGKSFADMNEYVLKNKFIVYPITPPFASYRDLARQSGGKFFDIRNSEKFKQNILNVSKHISKNIFQR